MKTQVQKEVLKLVPKTSYHHDRVIFLENSNGLDYEGAADTLREFLIENKIRHHVEYNLSKKTAVELEEIAASCLYSLVVFETTGISNTFRSLINSFIKLTNSGYRFRFIEASKYNFHFYVLPKEERAKLRSKTFAGIANAMAVQWSSYACRQRFLVLCRCGTTYNKTLKYK